MTFKKIFNLSELESFSKKYAKKISKSELILLRGDLGSGKTTLIRFIILKIFEINKLKPPKLIPSPSFPILQTYDLNKFCINHYDFYRLRSIREIIEIGFDENIEGNITFIEWPEIIFPLIKNYKYSTIELTVLNHKMRKLNIY